jgi:hypothetical protein
MTWNCTSRFWPGTRTYIMSNRTNPPPHIYTASLTANAITNSEKIALMNCVQTWPGTADATLKSNTVADISRAQATG